MTHRIRFDDETYRRLEAMYAAPDVAAQRRSVLEAIKLHPGDKVLDVGGADAYISSFNLKQS